MKKRPFVISFLFFSLILLLVGCNKGKEEEEKVFKFTEEIQKIVVIGKGVKSELGTRTIDDDAEINLIKEAMQNASASSKKQTSEGQLFDLEVILQDGSKEIINLWYYTSAETGRFYTDAMYSLNSQSAPELIKLLESFE